MGLSKKIQRHFGASLLFFKIQLPWTTMLFPLTLVSKSHGKVVFRAIASPFSLQGRVKHHALPLFM